MHQEQFLSPLCRCPAFFAIKRTQVLGLDEVESGGIKTTEQIDHVLMENWGKTVGGKLGTEQFFWG